MVVCGALAVLLVHAATAAQPLLRLVAPLDGHRYEMSVGYVPSSGDTMRKHCVYTALHCTAPRGPGVKAKMLCIHAPLAGFSSACLGGWVKSSRGVHSGAGVDVPLHYEVHDFDLSRDGEVCWSIFRYGCPHHPHEWGPVFGDASLTRCLAQGSRRERDAPPRAQLFHICRVSSGAPSKQ
jgi:hypothetical protein